MIAKKMEHSTIPAGHSVKWLWIAVEFRNGPKGVLVSNCRSAIHTIFKQCFQSTCNPFHIWNFYAIQVDCARHPRIVCGIVNMVMDCGGFGNCLAIRLHCVKITKNWKLMHNRPIKLRYLIDLQLFCNPCQPWQDGWDGTVICSWVANLHCNRRAILDCMEIVRYHGIATGFSDCW